MCGLEGLVLALRLATELIDKPWEPMNLNALSTTLTVGTAFYPPLAPWESQRRDAAKAEARDAKLKEFQQIARMCIPDKESSSGITWSGIPTKPFSVGDSSTGRLERFRQSPLDGELLDEDPGGPMRYPSESAWELHYDKETNTAWFGEDIFIVTPNGKRLNGPTK